MGQPVECSEEDRLEAGALDAFEVAFTRPDVTKGRCVDAAFTISDDPFDGEIKPGDGFFGKGEDGDVFRRTSLVGVYFDVGGLPLAGEFLMDGVVTKAGDESIYSFPVGCSLSLSRGNGGDRPIVRDSESGTEVFISPGETDHLVVGIPFTEGIVSGVKCHHAAALGDVFFKMVSRFERPGEASLWPAVGVLNDDVVFLEVGIPLFLFFFRSGCGKGADVYGVVFLGMEKFYEAGGRSFPVVVGESIDNEDVDRTATGEE